MQWVPPNYQCTAVSFLLDNPFSGLFMDPGLGKTSVSLAAIKILKYSGQLKGVLLIAPLRVAEMVWPEEIEKWINFRELTHTILHGKNKSSLWGDQKDIYIINPEGLPWLYRELADKLQQGYTLPFDALWIDESSKFKSPTAKTRFITIKDMLPLFNRRHIMTGTPAARNLMDLWSQAYILDKGTALGDNFYGFRNKYFEADDWNKYKWNLKEGAEEKIHAAIAPLVLEMSIDDHLDMPPIVYNNIKVELKGKALASYKKMEKEFFITLDGLDASAEAQVHASMKCHQMANGQVYENVPEGLTKEEERAFKRTRKTLHVHKEKLTAIRDLVDELAGKPLLVAYQYKHDLAALRSVFGEDVPHIGSGVSAAEANQIKQDWNAKKLPVLLGQPVGMAHGLNLQDGGNDVCWFSLTWDLELYIQFNARLHRSGVKGRVMVHHLLACDTIDEVILSRLGEKAELQTDLRRAIRDYRIKLTRTR